MKDIKPRIKIEVIGFLLILGAVSSVQGWTMPISTTHQTDATLQRFAAMTPVEIREYQSGILRKTAKFKRLQDLQPDILQQIADLTLIPPKINTNPLPDFDYDCLDYAMMLGVERTPGGRLWTLWVAGEDGPKAFMVAATSDDNGATWSKPRLVVNSHLEDFPIKTSVIVGNFWTDPLGRLWFFFDQTINQYDGRQGLWASICKNPDADEPVWSEPVRLWHGAVLNKPTVMANGEWWLPVEFPAIRSKKIICGVHDELNPLRGANVLVTADQGRTWEVRGRVRFPQPTWDEHMFVELQDGRVWMVARVNNRENGVMQSFSSDAGQTWTEPEFTTFVHPPARFHIRRLASNHILLIKHGAKIDAHEGRSQLTAWLSEDEGQTWLGGLMLDERKGISYPDVFQDPDGSVVTVYDRMRSPLGEIYMARFREEDIRAGAVVSSDAYLKHLIVQTPKDETKILHTLRDNADGESFMVNPAALMDATGAKVHVLEQGARIFSNRDYTFFQIPKALTGRRFVLSPLEHTEAKCVQSGMVYVLAPSSTRNPNDNQEQCLLNQGFRRVALPEFVITRIGGKARAQETCSVYQKSIKQGEFVRFKRWGVLVF